MFRLKKCIVFLGIALFFLSGCKETGTSQENNMREVSSEFRGLGRSILTEEEWKESGTLYEDVPVEFQDPVVETVLREMIEKPEGEVYISELQNIHVLSLDGEALGGPDQIDNLNDLSYCYNLQLLRLVSMEVPSLEPLYTLPQLEWIGFWSTSVTEEMLEEIGRLPVLERFFLGTGEFTDWGDLTDGSFLLPLADQLKVLYAQGNIDWNPEVLAQMTKLETLCIEYADDLSFLKRMLELKRLSLYCCTPEDWSPLGFLEQLEYLDIGGNMYTTVEITLDDLRPLEKLDYLSLGYTSINTECSRQEVIDAMPGLTGYHTY